jgi:hypothetical protein
MSQNPRALTGLHWAVVGLVTLIWWGVASFYAAIFLNNYPQYALLGYGSALACGLVLGLIHLGILALFRGKSALLGLVLAKLVAFPVTIGSGYFALAMGAMGTDSGMENAAKAIHMLVPFMMILATLPTTIAAFLGALIGWLIERSKRKSQVAEGPVSEPA